MERSGIRYSGMILHYLDHLKFDGAERNKVVWIQFHSITYHHIPPSNLGEINNLSYSILKFPNNGIRDLFRSIPLCYTQFRFVHFMISKHNLSVSLFHPRCKASLYVESKLVEICFVILGLTSFILLVFTRV